MRLLIDSHILLWWDMGGGEINKTAREAIADESNQIYVSVASIWELAIKRAKNKLTILADPPSLAVARNGFTPLPILPEHAEAAASLNWPHQDPFDRMLVAQAQVEGLTLVHSDRTIYGFQRIAQLWAR